METHVVNLLMEIHDKNKSIQTQVRQSLNAVLNMVERRCVYVSKSCLERLVKWLQDDRSMTLDDRFLRQQQELADLQSDQMYGVTRFFVRDTTTTTTTPLHDSYIGYVHVHGRVRFGKPRDNAMMALRDRQNMLRAMGTATKDEERDSALKNYLSSSYENSNDGSISSKISSSLFDGDDSSDSSSSSDDDD